MKREDLEHLIRAAAKVTGDDEMIVIGSQAILGAVPDAGGRLVTSMEADMYPKTRLDMADEIDGTLGELSNFHELHGYYASMVGPETAVAPEDWRDRLVPIRGENTNGATGWCMEPHDLVLAKLAAGRAKDLEFCRAAWDAKLLDRGVLRARAATMDPAKTDVGRIHDLIAAFPEGR